MTTIGLLHARRGAAQLVGELANVPELHRLAAGSRYCPLGADHDVDLVGALQLLLCVGARQVDLAAPTACA